MSSIFIVLFGLVGFIFGWFVYSKFIAEKFIGSIRTTRLQRTVSTMAWTMFLLTSLCCGARILPLLPALHQLQVLPWRFIGAGRPPSFGSLSVLSFSPEFTISVRFGRAVGMTPNQSGLSRRALLALARERCSWW